MRVIVTASVPADMAEALRAEATQADRTLSAEVRRAICAYLGNNDNGTPRQAPRVSTPAAGIGRDARAA